MICQCKYSVGLLSRLAALLHKLNVRVFFYIWYSVMFEGFETSNSCSVLAHMNVSKKGIFISTDYWKNENLKAQSVFWALIIIKAKNAGFLRLWYTYRNVFIILAVWISSQDQTAHSFRNLWSICILVSLANVLQSSTWLEKMSDLSYWLKTTVCFALVLDLEVNEAWFNCI